MILCEDNNIHGEVISNGLPFKIFPNSVSSNINIHKILTGIS
jgi:hypothetical protein